MCLIVVLLPQDLKNIPGLCGQKNDVGINFL